YPPIGYITGMPARILVSGVSGPVGAALLPSLRDRGYKVVRLVRGPASGDQQISWEPAKPFPAESVSGFEAVIHLAGESIVGRWTAAKKARISDSRVSGTRNLTEALAKAPQRPRILITASAAGYYGNRGDEWLREDSSPGHDFRPDAGLGGSLRGRFPLVGPVRDEAVAGGTSLTPPACLAAPRVARPRAGRT